MKSTSTCISVEKAREKAEATQKANDHQAKALVESRTLEDEMDASWNATLKDAIAQRIYTEIVHTDKVKATISVQRAAATPPDALPLLRMWMISSLST